MSRHDNDEQFMKIAFNINIEIFTTTYFAKGLGLVKYTREEKSDSETMGKIIYEKTINL